MAPRLAGGGYSLAGVCRGSRCGLRSGPRRGRFRPGGAGVTRSVSRFSGDAGLRLDRLAMGKFTSKAGRGERSTMAKP